MFMQNVHQGQRRCEACPGVGQSVRALSTAEQCHRCGDNYYAAQRGEFCVECTHSGGFNNVSREECDRCSNRYWNEEMSRCLIRQGAS